MATKQLCSRVFASSRSVWLVAPRCLKVTPSESFARLNAHEPVLSSHFGCWCLQGAFTTPRLTPRLRRLQFLHQFHHQHRELPAHLSPRTGQEAVAATEVLQRKDRWSWGRCELFWDGSAEGGSSTDCGCVFLGVICLFSDPPHRSKIFIGVSDSNEYLTESLSISKLQHLPVQSG